MVSTYGATMFKIDGEAAGRIAVDEQWDNTLIFRYHPITMSAAELMPNVGRRRK